MKKTLTILYVFFNSLFLPTGLFFTTLSTPFFLLKLLPKREFINNFIFFVLTLLFFAFFHLKQGVDLFLYLKSSFLIVSCFVFYKFFYAFLQKNNFLNFLDIIVKVNIVLVIIALFLYFTPYDNLLWYKTFYTVGVDRGSRLKLFTSESSVYSLILAPVFLFYIISFIKKNSFYTLKYSILVLIPLMLSFSFGVISAIGLAILITILSAVLNSCKHLKIHFWDFYIISIFIVVLIMVIGLIFIFPHISFSIRFLNFIQGNDVSGNARIFDAWFLAFQILLKKSFLWGIGVGQLNVVGFDIIDTFYNYYGTVHKVSLPNVVVETFVFFGVVGLLIRFGLLFYFFAKTKVAKSPYRLALFIFMFTYQFTGSYIMNIVEYGIWAISFSPIIDSFFPLYLNKIKLNKEHYNSTFN